MNYLLLNAATEAAQADVTLGDAAQELLGFAIVLLVLCALWMLTSIIGKIAKEFDAKDKPATTAAVAAAPAAPQEVSEGISDEEIVVISAAVSMLLADAPHRIVSLQQTQSTWGVEGRRRHFASHKIR